MTCAQRPQLHQRVRPARTTARWLRELGLATALILIMVAPPGAQTPAVTSVPAGVITPIHQQIDLLVGRSAVLTTDRPIRRVSLSTPDVADALVTSPHEVLIHGKAPGTISLLVWSDTGRISSHDVVVRRDLDALEEHLSQLFPGEAITVAANGSDIVIAGTVSSQYVVEKAAAVVVGHVENAENVVNLLRQQEGVAAEQIMLRVRFAEVSRTALQELGASFFTNILGHNDFVGRLTTQQFAAPDFDADEGLVFSDFLNVLAFNTSEDIGVVIKALKTRGLFQSLAEPNLITQNGTEAMFLAGGEYPYPVLQGTTGAVTVHFKEFGVLLRFTPTIVGPDRIHLKVAPEVSALDFSNSISISGFRVPSLTTRRTETEVELRDGQTFAIAGLIDNTVTETMSKIPGLGDIPILGLLFKSRAYQKHQTELVVMITAHIVRSDSSGVAPRLPDLVQPFLDPPDETLPPPPASQFGADRSGGIPDVAATVLPDAIRPSLSEAIPAVVTAPVLAAGGPATAVGTTLDPRAERKRLEEERKQAEKTRKAGEKLAREEAKRAAEQAARAAKVERKRLEEERKQAEKTRKAEEKLAREAGETRGRAGRTRRQGRAEAARRRAEAGGEDPQGRGEGRTRGSETCGRASRTHRQGRAEAARRRAEASGEDPQGRGEGRTRRGEARGRAGRTRGQGRQTHRQGRAKAIRGGAEAGGEESQGRRKARPGTGGGRRKAVRVGMEAG